MLAKLAIEKDSVIPYYLQLKDQIEFYISNNEVKTHQLLPGINVLAKELAINAATVRKAYGELERDGLIVVRKAKGTHVVDRPLGNADVLPLRGIGQDVQSYFKKVIQELIRNGVPITNIYQECRKIIKETLDEEMNRYVIFTECNRYQLDVVSHQIEKCIQMRVVPVHLSEINSTLTKSRSKKELVKAIITTEFHIDEVENLLGTRYKNIIGLRMNMSPEVRNEINKISPNENIAFICRNKKAIPLYKKLLSAQLGKRIKLLAAFIGDEKHVMSVIQSADVLLITPPTYQEIKRYIAGKRVINVFDQIDPLSLQMLKENISSN